MQILQIHSSARVEGSFSAKLAHQLVARLQAQQDNTQLVFRDLAKQPHPMLDEAALQALFTPAAQRSAEQAARVALDDALIAELQASDVIVIAAPMYNFGITSLLKNWIDAVARAGVTFRYTANGPEGLVTGKKVYVVLTRGGVYENTPLDTQQAYLKSFFAFLGMTDVEFLFAEGLAMGEAAAQQALAKVEQQIQEVVLL